MLQAVIFGISCTCLWKAAELTQGFNMTFEYTQLKNWLIAEVILYCGLIGGCVFFMAMNSIRRFNVGLFPGDASAKTDFLEAQQVYSGFISTCFALVMVLIFVA